MDDLHELLTRGFELTIKAAAIGGLTVLATVAAHNVYEVFSDNQPKAAVPVACDTAADNFMDYNQPIARDCESISQPILNDWIQSPFISDAQRLKLQQELETIKADKDDADGTGAMDINIFDAAAAITMFSVATRAVVVYKHPLDTKLKAPSIYS